MMDKTSATSEPSETSGTSKPSGTSEPLLPQRQLSKLIRDAYEEGATKILTSPPSKNPATASVPSSDVEGSILASGNRCVLATERQGKNTIKAFASTMREFGRFCHNVSVYFVFAET